MLLMALVGVIIFWCVAINRLTLAAIYPQLASSRGISVNTVQTCFTTTIAIIVTLSISWVGLMILNSLLVLPGATSRNIAKNLKQYHLFSVIIALIAGIAGLVLSYYLGASAGASISLVSAVLFLVSFIMRKVKK